MKMMKRRRTEERIRVDEVFQSESSCKTNETICQEKALIEVSLQEI